MRAWRTCVSGRATSTGCECSSNEWGVANRAGPVSRRAFAYVRVRARGENVYVRTYVVIVRTYLRTSK